MLKLTVGKCRYEGFADEVRKIAVKKRKGELKSANMEMVGRA